MNTGQEDETRRGKYLLKAKLFILIIFFGVLSFNHDVLFSDTCQGRRSWPEEEQEQEGQARSQGGGGGANPGKVVALPRHYFSAE